MSYTGNEPSEYVNRKLEEIQNMEVSENEKELAYRIGTQIFDVDREIQEYPFQQAYAFLLDSFDIVYDMIQSGRNNEHEIQIIKDLAKDSEKIFSHLQQIKRLVERIDTNNQTLEKKLNKENTERKKIIGEIIGEMRNQNP
jgi:hypothetical protein